MKREHFCDRSPVNVVKITLFALGGILLAVLFGLAFGWVVQYLWNHIIVSLFSIREIGYLEAVGIIVLCKLLFGGMHHPHHDKRDRISRKDYRHLHEFFGENRDDIASFWESEGREAFRKFRENRENRENGKNANEE